MSETEQYNQAHRIIPHTGIPLIKNIYKYHKGAA